MTGVEEDFLLDIVMLRLSQVKNLVRTALLWKETATDSNPPLSTYMHKRPRWSSLLRRCSLGVGVHDEPYERLYRRLLSKKMIGKWDYSK